MLVDVLHLPGVFHYLHVYSMVHWLKEHRLLFQRPHLHRLWLVVVIAHQRQLVLVLARVLIQGALASPTTCSAQFPVQSLSGVPTCGLKWTRMSMIVPVTSTYHYYYPAAAGP